MNTDTDKTEENRFPVPPTGSILIVDDELSVREILLKYLTRLGYEVDTAEDGMAATRKMEEHVFDLVITDLKMPNLDGRSLLKIMAEKHPDIPKIVLTGLGTNDDILLALKTGAYDFLTKPIMDFAILQHSITRALERKRLQDEKNRYIQQLRQINNVISMLNSGKNTDEIFATLYVILKKSIPFNRLTLTTIDGATNIVVTKLVESDRSVLLGTGDSYPLEESSLLESARSKEVLIINDLVDYAGRHPESRSSRLLLEEGMRSSLVLPLIINNVTRGFLLFASEEINSFKAEHITFLESVVGHISLSIERGELMEEVEVHSKNLEQLVKIRTHEVLKIQKTTIFALSNLAEARDSETGAHLDRMRNYCVLIAQILKYSGQKNDFSNQFLRDLYDSSILHDIGKVGIPDSILLKAGGLTPEEWLVMKTHTVIGYNALKSASRDLGENSFLNMGMDITLYHHERWDGSGYPHGLRENEIPLSARIVSLGDVYDALTSQRPYKEAYPHDKAIAIMKDIEITFDPHLFRIFYDNAGEFNRIRQEFQ